MLARSGLITAHAELTAEGVKVSAPLHFDEALVVETGSWLIDTQDIGDALEEVYMANYEDWCARVSAERAARAAEQPRPRRRSFASSNMHTPCPALWAGR
jgi:hypothetical protein